MSEITAASQEQSAGISEVNQAIAQMDEMTQQNAALVEQAAAAAESLQDQAAALVQAVAVFNLGDRTQAAPVVALPRRSTAPAKLALDVVARVSTVGSNKKVAAKHGDDSWEEF
jgi:methyl-accepting chemotaxis protein